MESFEEGDHITSYIESHNNPYNHRLSELGSGLMLQVRCGGGRGQVCGVCLCTVACVGATVVLHGHAEPTALHGILS